MRFLQFVANVKTCPTCTGRMYVHIDASASRIICFDGCSGYFERSNAEDHDGSVEYKLRKE